MPNSAAVSPLLMPAARNRAVSAAKRISAERARQNPPPMAGPLTAATTGWCRRRMVVITSSRSSMERRAMVGERESVDLGKRPWIFKVGPRAEPPARTRDDHDTNVVVAADLSKAVPERDHDVECHRIHAFWPIEGDQGDVGMGRGDIDEGHGWHRTQRSRCGEDRYRVPSGFGGAVLQEVGHGGSAV